MNPNLNNPYYTQKDVHHDYQPPQDPFFKESMYDKRFASGYSA